MTTKTIINSEQSLKAYIEHIKIQFDKNKYLTVSLSTGKQRTATQNASLHKYFTLLAEALNAAGYDMRRTLKHDIDIPWTMEAVKEHLWKPLQEAMTKERSTAKVERKDYSMIYDVLSRHLSQKLGVFVSWPSKDNMKG